jgi:S-adenosylmethionine synthetase
MPLFVWLANRIIMRYDAVRKSGALPWLRPTASARTYVSYELNDPVITVIEMHFRYDHAMSGNRLREAVMEEIVTEEVIRPAIPEAYRSDYTQFRLHGESVDNRGSEPQALGSTGSKINVATYGGVCPYGDGAFCGQNPLHVDRAATYMARYIANNIVAAGILQRCTVQCYYTMCSQKPLDVRFLFTEQEGIDEKRLGACVEEVFDLTPGGIIETLELAKQTYRQSSVYGHFGREDRDLPWDRTDRADQLRQAYGLTRTSKT